MKLPFFQSATKPKNNYYLTLLLQDERIIASILEEQANTLSLFAVAEATLRVPLESAEFEDILAATDRAISQAEQELGEKVPNYKTIFGVQASWTTEGRITQEKLTLLKKICEELSLTPIGFLVFTEAIVHLLHKKEGAPVSAIMVELGKHSLRVSIVRAGRILESATQPLEEDVPALVDAILKTFTQSEILPSRIVLFDGEDNEKISQSFLSHHWSKSLPFLHMPQVTILDPNFDLQGVLFGTATQLGLNMSSNALATIKTKTTIPQFEPQEELEPSTRVSQPEEPEEIPEEEPEDEEDIQPEPQEEAVKEETHEAEPTPEKKDVHLISDNIAAEYFGFSDSKPPVIGTHVPVTHLPASQEEADAYTENLPEISHQERLHEESEEEEQGLMLRGSAAGVVTQGKNLVQGFLSGVHTIIMKGLSAGPLQHVRGIGALAVVLILIGGVGLFFAYRNVLKATVTLTFNAQALTQNVPVTFSTTGANGSITVSSVQSVNSVSDSIQTSGTKDIGNKATGTVSLFSRASKEIDLSKGTKLTASNGLIYTLDSTTVVASFSGGPDDPATVVNNVAVTANDIGKDYNIPAGTKFTVAGQSKSDVSAKNDAAFTGGTKTSITVVSQDDITKLTNQVLQKAKDQAAPSLQSNNSGDKQVLDASVQQTMTEKTFSSKLGDQVSSLNLTAKVQTTASVYSKNDLNQAIMPKLTHDANTTIMDKSLQVKLDNVTSKNNVTAATAIVVASLLPTIDQHTLAQTLAGKSFSDAVTALKALPDLQDAAVQLNPAIPFLPKTLPANAANISFQIRTQ